MRVIHRDHSVGADHEIPRKARAYCAPRRAWRACNSRRDQRQGPSPAGKSFLKSDSSQKNAYSDAVITEGGRAIWIAGQGAPVDASGKSLAGDFDAQARATFAGIGKTLERAGAKLSDMVTMTVFITDDRYGRQFLAISREIFGDNFPASALITIRALAQPSMLIEIQGVAVTG